jgi:hypothetical protein
MSHLDDVRKKSVSVEGNSREQSRYRTTGADRMKPSRSPSFVCLEILEGSIGKPRHPGFQLILAHQPKRLGCDVLADDKTLDCISYSEQWVLFRVKKYGNEYAEFQKVDNTDYPGQSIVESELA